MARDVKILTLVVTPTGVSKSMVRFEMLGLISGGSTLMGVLNVIEGDCYYRMYCRSDRATRLPRILNQYLVYRVVVMNGYPVDSISEEINIAITIVIIIGSIVREEPTQQGRKRNRLR